MDKLEKKEITNPDENRMVGHYWLRNPNLSPSSPEIRLEIEETVTDIEKFAAKIHCGDFRGAGRAFKNLLLIGIGGSALGPQFGSNALSHPPTDKLDVYFSDNTDPDGIDRVLAAIEDALNLTLYVVISKSGRTKETRNRMLEAEAAYREKTFNFAAHPMIITGKDSELDRYAEISRWLETFPMWDWIDGTRELFAVGLLPAALQHFYIRGILRAACITDEITQNKFCLANQAVQIARAYLFLGNDKAIKNVVVLAV